LLESDPDCESGSGDPLNPDPMRILIRNTGLAEERRAAETAAMPSDPPTSCDILYSIKARAGDDFFLFI
jgi:hypothetical protein